MPDLTGPCAQHPTAPVIDGLCGGCTIYPADMRRPSPAAAPCLRHPAAGLIGGVCRGCFLDLSNAAADARIRAVAEHIRPEPCPPGIHSLFDACPGDCTKPVDDLDPATITQGPHVPAVPALTQLIEALDALPKQPPVRPYPDPDRRAQYGALIRERIRALTVPSGIPGLPPTMGATEHDIADVVLAAADAETAALRAELAQARAERDAALRIASVWDDAPDPSCRAMAADLRSTIHGARPPAPGEPCHDCEIGAHGPNAHRRHLPPHPAAARCGETAPGLFGYTLGPCIDAPKHEGNRHHDARGAEWWTYGPGPAKTAPGTPTIPLATTPVHVDCECGSCATGGSSCTCEPTYCPSAPHNLTPTPAPDDRNN